MKTKAFGIVSALLAVLGIVALAVGSSGGWGPDFLFGELTLLLTIFAVLSVVVEIAAAVYFFKASKHQ